MLLEVLNTVSNRVSPAFKDVKMAWVAELGSTAAVVLPARPRRRELHSKEGGGSSKNLVESGI